MKKLIKLMFVFMLVPALTFVSCNKSDDDDNGGSQPQVNAYEVLKTYLVQNNMDLDDITAANGGFVITADAINAKGTGDYFIVDIRQEADFNTAHIDGAVRTTLGEILTAVQGATKPIVVVCYTGQTACHAVVALRLSGYMDAKALKWGMAGWNSQFSAAWETKTGDIALTSPNWVAAPGTITPSADFSAPTFTSLYTTGPEILTERVNYMLSQGFKTVANTDVLGTPSNYFINNYWKTTDVETYGNITGAYRILPLTLENNEFKHLDAGKTVVTYCWTGQTSSIVTAYLTIMGYDAKSLTFGTNGMIYSNLADGPTKWHMPGTDYPVVP